MSIVHRSHLCAWALTALMLPAAPPADMPQAKSTLENLQSAYNGESNAHAKYLAYAEKARAEGYPKVATLFTAAARSEAIHAANHAEVIRNMGAKPEADVQVPAVGSTQENLQEALAGESYERDLMYPAFLAKARQEGHAEAIRTLNLARNAEIEHARLYQAALDEPDAWPTVGVSYYVCPVCGWTSETLPAERCPSSFTPKSRFLTVS